MRQPGPEATISHDIRLALGSEPDLVLWRNSTGAGEVEGRWQSWGLCKGGADLVGMLGPHARWFCLETKSKRGRHEDDQKLFAALVRRHGGFYALARSVADARAALERARAGGNE